MHLGNGRSSEVTKSGYNSRINFLYLKEIPHSPHRHRYTVCRLTPSLDAKAGTDPSLSINLMIDFIGAVNDIALLLSRIYDGVKSNKNGDNGTTPIEVKDDGQT